MDFKGPPEVARRRVTPLSVLDDHSRYLLCMRACTDITFATVQAALWDLFGEVGPPAALLCDNAFSAMNSGVGLSSFDAWLLRLGIDPAQGRPYHQQTQGEVERFHGTLEAEVWPRARRDALEHFAADLEGWRPVDNTQRPHEAPVDRPPVAAQPEAPAAVGQVGDVRYRGARIMAGLGLAGQPVRIEERDGVVAI